MNRVNADAGRRVNLNLDSQSEYSPSNGRQGLRGRLRYGIGGPSGWRTATYDCVVDVRRNRVEHVTYSPRASSGNWPGGPGIPPRPGYPGGPGYPGVPNYPRVKVDTSGRGTFNSTSLWQHQNHSWFCGQHGTASVGFSARRKLPGYFLRSGRAFGWRRVHHADHRLRSGRRARDGPSPPQPRSQRG